jgi:hypothetical protein
MPDKYHLRFMQDNIIDTLIERVKTDIESVVINIIKTLSRLATKRECKARILMCGGLDMAMSFINTSNDDLKYEIYKLLYNL